MQSASKEGEEGGGKEEEEEGVGLEAEEGATEAGVGTNRRARGGMGN